MTELDYIILIAGIIHVILICIAVIVIYKNKKMSSFGRVLRILEIIILPILGPIFTLIEVLYWRTKKEKL